MKTFEALSRAIRAASETAEDPRIRIASLVVVTGQKVLMGRRTDTGKYTFPGGHIDAGEKPIQGGLRELFEETGIRAPAIDLVSETDVVGHAGKNLLIFLFSLHTTERPTTSRFDPDNEVKKWEWIPYLGGLPEEVLSNLHVPAERNSGLSLLR